MTGRAEPATMHAGATSSAASSELAPVDATVVHGDAALTEPAGVREEIETDGAETSPGEPEQT